MKPAHRATALSAVVTAAIGAALTLVLATSILSLPSCRQSQGATEDTFRQKAARIPELHPPTNKGRDQFDLEKLLIGVKPGERIGLHELPDKLAVGGIMEFVMGFRHEDEATGVGSRGYDFGPYHLAVVAGPEYVGIMKVTTKEAAAQPLEVYPGIWMCKTTRPEIVERFGDTWGATDYPEIDLGYPAIQKAWVEIDYDKATSVITSFYVQYVGE